MCTQAVDQNIHQDCTTFDLNIQETLSVRKATTAYVLIGLNSVLRTGCTWSIIKLF